LNGGAEPRLTSGGEAGVDGVKFQDQHCGYGTGLRYRLENQDLILKLDSIRSGFAAPM